MVESLSNEPLSGRAVPGSEEEEVPVKGIFGFFRRKGPEKKGEGGGEEGDATKVRRARQLVVLFWARNLLSLAFGSACG